MDKSEKIASLFESDNQSQSFGCVLFDLQEIDGKNIPQPGSGWASIEGGPAFRIHGVNDLLPTVKWWSNLSQEIFWKSGAVRNNKLKHSGYLRTDMSQILREIGLYGRQIPIVKVCEALSEIFYRVMTLAKEHFLLKEFNQSDLPSEIKTKLNLNDFPISNYVDEAMFRSYQDLVICDQDVSSLNNDSITVLLRRPRHFHAERILSSMIPVWKNDWEFTDAFPSNKEECIDFLVNSERPFVAKITINHYYASDNGFLNFANLLNPGIALGEGGRKKERNWVSQPELLYLSKFADITVEGAFFASGYQSLSLPFELPNYGELSIFSLSVGLLSECYWMAFASRSVNQKSKTKNLITPRACWLRAADRFLCFTSAMLLASVGIQILSYGAGAVLVRVRKNDYNKLIDLAPHCNLVLPVHFIEEAQKENYMR